MDKQLKRLVSIANNPLSNISDAAIAEEELNKRYTPDVVSAEQYRQKREAHRRRVERVLNET